MFKLAYAFKKIKFNHNETIFEEGDKADKIYLIKKG